MCVTVVKLLGPCTNAALAEERSFVCCGFKLLERYCLAHVHVPGQSSRGPRESSNERGRERPPFPLDELASGFPCNAGQSRSYAYKGALITPSDDHLTKPAAVTLGSLLHAWERGVRAHSNSCSTNLGVYASSFVRAAAKAPHVGVLIRPAATANLLQMDWRDIENVCISLALALRTLTL